MQKYFKIKCKTNNHLSYRDDTNYMLKSGGECDT